MGIAIVTVAGEAATTTTADRVDATSQEHEHGKDYGDGLVK